MDSEARLALAGASVEAARGLACRGLGRGGKGGWSRKGDEQRDDD
jgi:hypothetical protein